MIAFNRHPVWGEFLRLQAVATMWFILPSIATVVMFAVFGNSRVPDWVLISPFVVGALVYSWAARRLLRWKCPRCGGEFARRALHAELSNSSKPFPLFRRECVHCGLKVGDAIEATSHPKRETDPARHSVR